MAILRGVRYAILDYGSLNKLHLENRLRAQVEV